MYLTPLQPIKTTKEITDVFGGINRTNRISENEFSEMEGLVSDGYPHTRVRDDYKVLLDIAAFDLEENNNTPVVPESIGDTNTVTVGNRLFYANLDSGSTFKISYLNLKGDTPGGDVTGSIDIASNIQMAVIGAYIYIYTSEGAYYFNYFDGEDEAYMSLKPCNVNNELTDVTVSFAYTKLTDNGYDDISVTSSGTAPPSNPRNGEYWLDTGNKVLKQWDAERSMWLSIPTTYLKISATSIGTGLSDGDAVEITGINRLPSDIKYWVVDKATSDYIIITCLVNNLEELTTSLTVKREAPDMSHICSFNNRIWGTSTDGTEVYASKLGDFKNWKVFAGLSSDSYAVTIGTAGQFTAIYPYQNRIFAFKEECIEKIYGTMPSNYQTSEIKYRGVGEGCTKSLVILNDYLYYAGSDGIYRFDGSLPLKVSDNLGRLNIAKATGAQMDGKYYVSIDNVIYVYDTRYGFWHKESEIDDLAELIAVNYHDEDYIAANIFSLVEGVPPANNRVERKTLLLSGGSNRVKWYAQTGKLAITLSGSGYKRYSTNGKYVSSLAIRHMIDKGSTLNIFIAYDGGDFQLLDQLTGNGEVGKTVLRFRQNRCDYIRIRFEGEGQTELMTINKTISLGSEVTR